jgi:hypothetical protein
MRTASPTRPPADADALIREASRWVVYAGNGTTAIRSDLAGRPRVLGKTPFFAPSAIRGHVWLQYLGRPAARIRQVLVSSGRPGPAITLPAGMRLVAGTDAGLLLQYQGKLRLWRPGGLLRPLPGDPFWGNGFAVTPQLIAYGTRCRDARIPQRAAIRPNSEYPQCSMLRVFDVTTGRVLTFRPPAGTTAWVPPEFGLENPVSPSASMIAAEAVVASVDNDRGRLYLLRLTGRHRRPLAVPQSGGYLFSKAAWSPDGSWLFYQGPAGMLWGYDLRSHAVRSSSVPCCQYTVIAVIRAPLTAASGRR